MADPFAASALIAFRALGRPAIYTAPGGSPIQCLAIVTKDVVEVSGDGFTRNRRTQVGLLIQQVGTPKQGATVAITDGDTYALKGRDTDDGIEARWWV